MLKRFNLEVNRTSWTDVPPGLRKTCPFQPSQSEAAIDFNGALLWMGKMSVPLKLPNWAIASQWAKIRYFTAASLTEDLRMHSAVDDLDTHQKKVLSDDWGVGFSLQWLASSFGYTNVEHGLEVMQDLCRNRLATFLQEKKKVGPNKCPDFIARDSQGRIHIIECKGTQQGSQQVNRQVARGRQQKGNIQFSPGPEFHWTVHWEHLL